VTAADRVSPVAVVTAADRVSPVAVVTAADRVSPVAVVTAADRVSLVAAISNALPPDLFSPDLSLADFGDATAAATTVNSPVVSERHTLLLQEQHTLLL
jgi:hypothetical protein